jgi:histidinol-phosphate phosphatase family protein
MQNKAIFFDRDDTLIIDKNYMFKPDDLEFFPDTISTLKSLQQAGYLLFIVTNQSGVGRGYFSVDQMHEFNNHMLRDLKSKGIEIKELVFCPHAPDDGCDCRKPSPKLINELCQKYNILKSQSFMVGDKVSDVESGKAAGLKSIGINIEADHKINHLKEILNRLT